MGKLYVFGDSYSTPNFCVEPRDSWWGLMADQLNYKIEGVDNFSWPGNNIDSISHLIVANKDIFQKDDFIVVGIPPIERITYYDETARTKLVVKFDNTMNEVGRVLVPRHNSLVQKTMHQLDRKITEIWNRSWQEAQVLRNLLMLACFLEKITIRFMFVNLAEPFQPPTQWPVLETLQNQVLERPEMLVLSDTYFSVNYNKNKPVDFDTYGWHGHHGVVGNLHWYQTVLLPRMKALEWL